MVVVFGATTALISDQLYRTSKHHLASSAEDLGMGKWENCDRLNDLQRPLTGFQSY